MTDKISALTARLHADGFDSAQIAALQDAFTYMDRVQRRFAHDPEPLERFNDIARAFGTAAAGTIEVETVVRRVSELFVEHPELFEGFRSWVRVESLATRSEEGGGVEGASIVAEGAGDGDGRAERYDVVEVDIAGHAQQWRERTSRRRLERTQANDGILVLGRAPQNAFQAHLLRDPLLPLPAGVTSPWLRRLQARHSGGERAVWVDYRSGVPRVSGLVINGGEMGVGRRPVGAERDGRAARRSVNAARDGGKYWAGRGQWGGEERCGDGQ
ncbi:NACHT domain- and WD repeat-containing protein 1 [Friedmanniomyces endolithicus]|nr:NACHT domain- and WD repeat-containing protein 1 [Friedmanniomyces endolithicus]